MRPIPRAVVTNLIPLLAAACSPTGGYKITPIPADQSLEERIVDRHPGWVSNRIVVLDISGILMNAHEFGLLSEGEHPVSLAVEKLTKAAQDKRVKAVVLRINSPGGTVTASDTLYQEILAFRKKTGKPVVAYFQDVAASGAYYIACAADRIVAQRTSVTGSIGVMMQLVDVSNTMSKVGISADAIVSGPFKDTGSPLRKMRPEEREILQGLVDSFYRQFIEVVAAGRRNLTPDAVTKLADGRVYSAEQAMEHGLVDQVGTLQDAIDLAKSRAGVPAAHTVVYHRPLDWKPNVYARSGVGGPQTVNLLNINLPRVFTSRPEFLYIWTVNR